jgi:septum formation protein
LRISPENPLVLGSASPRRRELIAMLGIPFVVRVARVDEAMQRRETPETYLDRVTRSKLDAVLEGAEGLGPAAVVLAADTIVVSPGGAVLGKPSDDGGAREMIEQLSGATHEVSTRFVLALAAAREPLVHAQTVTTRVTFRPLASDEMSAYVATGEGRDKAGAYAVQGLAASFVERIDGSYTNVVGLPLCQVLVAMRALGWW